MIHLQIHLPPIIFNEFAPLGHKSSLFQHGSLLLLICYRSAGSLSQTSGKTAAAKPAAARRERRKQAEVRKTRAAFAESRSQHVFVYIHSSLPSKSCVKYSSESDNEAVLALSRRRCTKFAMRKTARELQTVQNSHDASFKIIFSLSVVAVGGGAAVSSSAFPFCQMLLAPAGHPFYIDLRAAISVQTHCNVVGGALMLRNGVN